MPSVINSDNGVISGTSGLKTSGSNDGLLDFQSNGTRIAGITTSAFQVGTDNISAVNSMGFRNRIINGDMRIDQRNAGASITGNDGTFGIDRWVNIATQTAKFTVQQNAGSVTPPTGFINYLGATSSSAFSVAASDFFQIRQRIEGLNVSDLGWGTANAQAVTLSFWVRSSLTGTFGGAINNSAANRSYPFSYTISAANTWEQKTVSITGDTSGTWLTTNGIGIQVSFSLGAGSSVSGTAGSWSGSGLSSATGAVSVVGTNGATFYITGVQLEAGSVATPFERRDYGRELIMCQRYYWRTDPSPINQYLTSFYAATGSGDLYTALTFPVFMRAAPTVTPTLGSDVSGVNAVVAGTVSTNNSRLTFTKTSTSGYYSLNSLQASAEL